MGSFSMKCAVSNLPITAGDSTVMLLGETFKGRKAWDTGGFIMQNHFFNLIAPPIFGAYNDYGWIEDTEPDCLKFAAEVIGLLGELKGTQRCETPVDIQAPDVHWSYLKDQITELVPGYDYTFIHRTVWDQLVAASSKNYQEGYLFYSEESELDQAIKTKAQQYGMKLNTYHAHGYPADHFNLALDLWQTDLVKHKTKPKCELTQAEYLEELMSELNYHDSPSTRLAPHFVGFFNYTDGNNRKIKVDLVDDMVKLINTPGRKEVMIQTQTFYNALLKGGIVVRGNKEIASEEQCGGAYWPHVALYKGMRTAMLNEHANVVGDEPDNYTGKVMTEEECLEDLSNRQLREGYDLD